jgi:Ni/Co efflux regulator RcnB
MYDEGAGSPSPEGDGADDLRHGNRGRMDYIGDMLRSLPLVLIAAFAAPAFAQIEQPLPRFEGLEMQIQREEQRQLDELETSRQRERQRALLPGSGTSAAEAALRDLELRHEQDRLLLQLEQDRAREQRERDLAANALPNARVPAASSAVVSQPEAYLLPPAPPGKYYARVNGRFVIVDATSELVEQVLPVQPTDPTADVPAGPRPLPSVDMNLPLRRVAPTSALVIANPASLALPAPPAGQYYARVDGKIVLVEARTELPVKVVRAG